MMLDEEKKRFIDDHFREDPSPDFGKLTELKTSEELHYLADIANWDIHVPLLQWIAEQSLCSRATARMMFWRAQPDEFVCYDWDAETVNYGGDTFYLIKTIVENDRKGFYARTDIFYDPAMDMPEDELQVPDFMFEPAQGHAPYFVYEKAEIRSWFGEYLEKKIKNCDSAIDLFNIAFFEKDPNRAQLILQHQLCDKGTALMLFWRLRTYARLYPVTGPILDEIVKKIGDDKYREALAYDPKRDTRINLTRIEKWGIPDSMREPIGTAPAS